MYRGARGRRAFTENLPWAGVTAWVGDNLLPPALLLPEIHDWNRGGYIPCRWEGRVWRRRGGSPKGRILSTIDLCPWPRAPKGAERPRKASSSGEGHAASSVAAAACRESAAGRKVFQSHTSRRRRQRVSLGSGQSPGPTPAGGAATAEALRKAEVLPGHGAAAPEQGWAGVFWETRHVPFMASSSPLSGVPVYQKERSSNPPDPSEPLSLSWAGGGGAWMELEVLRGRSDARVPVHVRRRWEPHTCFQKLLLHTRGHWERG